MLSQQHTNLNVNGGRRPVATRDEDSDDEVLASTLVEALQEDDDLESLDNSSTAPQGIVRTDDLQARLAAAAQPLDFSAPLEVRFASYDNYCSLFHFILNSDGPVELELPTVSRPDVWS